MGCGKGIAACFARRGAEDPMTLDDMRARADQFEIEAVVLHERSAAAGSMFGAVLLRFRALWKEEAARLLRRHAG